MRPIANKNFGPTGLAVSFNNGTSVVTGYIVKQLSTNKFKVTSDGVNLFDCRLAKTDALAAAPGAGFMTIVLTTPNGTEYVRSISDTTLYTIDLNRYIWTLGTSVNGSLAVATFATTQIPGAPTSLTVGTITNTSIALTWAAGTGATPTSYTVQYRTHGTTPWTTFGTQPTTGSVTVTGLTASVQYDFQVDATNTYGTGPYCAFVSGTTT
jgi:hypothetical protein